MKLAAILLSAAMLPATALAANDSCESQKYHQYIDASLTWYQQLVDITVEKDASLKDVGDWFLEGRKHHFELNREVFDWYLANDKEKLDLSQPVESWLKLTQQDVKALAEQHSELGKTAKQAFDDRQSKPHPQNYALRSAFAELLTHPGKIEKPLNDYNKAMTAIADISCD
ncbi:MULTISPECIES: hypothetical protein [Photobacterium]|uniref:Uncharacterized protein n=1 Tax=Photobacterium ganghwense TaxID=320778 RepID=A0A0J1HAQ2_9GAMM|nr:MULTISPECIES: hypothetical protein [Photobacterium]KLV08714.1 hypothetical protein ABT57_12915 [Photobacterium ganghwense]MBV1839914.1 hypothetical protein [Photobacterium ganghwense]PSU10838.1 hypothetical protein C9I92_01570 [Photobacterium ganghwense]QSV12940.1 hypothetical protein FH974_09170 [Photobacterium ganghwense]